MRKISDFLIRPPFVAIVDLALIHASFLAAFLMSCGGLGVARQDFRAYVHVMPWISFASLAALYICGLYTGWVRRTRTSVVCSIVFSTVLVLLSTTAIWFWEWRIWISRPVLLDAGFVLVLALLAHRLFAQNWYLYAVGCRKVMLITPDEQSAVQIIHKLQNSKSPGLSVCGYLLCSEVQNLGDLREEFDSVLIAPGVPNALAIIERCESWKKDVMVLPTALELLWFGSHPIEIDDVLVLAARPPMLASGQAFVKRACDLFFATALLLLTSPVLLLVAILVRMTSKGPVIFKQDRVGKNGVEFDVYKFRTMVDDAERLTGPVLAALADPRITKVGAVLRATRVDELPQLLNVLIGNMSLIGPRPERKCFVDEFQHSVPGYQLRLSVKPGVTGLAQVAGRYSTTVERKLRFDLMYIYNYSLTLDFQILLRTILVVLGRKQADGITESWMAQSKLHYNIRGDGIQRHSSNQAIER